MFMLGDGFVIVVIFLVDEGDGYGGGGMEHFSVFDCSIPMSEYYCPWGDDLGFACAGRLRIFTRPTREKVGSVYDVCNVLCKRIILGSGE